jgi:hypothetical protein
LKQFRAGDVEKISVAERELSFDPVTRSGDWMTYDEYNRTERHEVAIATTTHPPGHVQRASIMRHEALAAAAQPVRPTANDGDNTTDQDSLARVRFAFDGTLSVPRSARRAWVTDGAPSSHRIRPSSGGFAIAHRV